MDSDAPVDVRPATERRWDDLVELFERPGPRGGRPVTANCWCVMWRARSGEAAENRDSLCALVQGGQVPGLLAYEADRAVGWVSVAPRKQFSGLARSPMFRPRDDEAGVYLVSCFYVHSSAKGKGVASRLLDAAVTYAAEHGATAVEAYPGEPADYKGRLEAFLSRGFEPVRTAGKRTLVRLDCHDPAGPPDEGGLGVAGP